LDDLEGHWRPVRSAILATIGFLVLDSSYVVCASANGRRYEKR